MSQTSVRRRGFLEEPERTADIGQLDLANQNWPANKYLCERGQPLYAGNHTGGWVLVDVLTRSC
jgi:hypothetical protein